MSAAETKGRVTIGAIGPAFGIQGWVHIQSFTQPIENVLNYPIWQLESKDKTQTFTLESGKVHGKGIVAKLKGCDDRDLAESLRSSKIIVSREELPELDEGEFYWSDLEGLTVLMDGKSIGVVDHLYETGSMDVMVVRDGQKTQHIPFSMGDVVTKVCLDSKEITVDWLVIE